MADERRQARAEIDRGWPLVLAAALAVAAGSMGIGFYSLGLFVKPLQAEFGWSRSGASGAATFQQLGIFMSAPIVGHLVDRVRSSTIALLSYAGATVALLALSSAGPSLAGWYALWLLLALAGCGTTPALWARIISLRFDARSSRAWTSR